MKVFCSPRTKKCHPPPIFGLHYALALLSTFLSTRYTLYILTVKTNGSIKHIQHLRFNLEVEVNPTWALKSKFHLRIGPSDSTNKIE